MAGEGIRTDELDQYRAVVERLPESLQIEAAVDVRPTVEFGTAPPTWMGPEKFVYRATGEEVKAGEMLGYLRGVMTRYLNSEAVEWRLVRILGSSRSVFVVPPIQGNVRMAAGGNHSVEQRIQGEDELCVMAELCRMCARHIALHFQKGA